MVVAGTGRGGADCGVVCQRSSLAASAQNSVINDAAPAVDEGLKTDALPGGAAVREDGAWMRAAAAQRSEFDQDTRRFQSDRGLAHDRCRSSGLDASIAIISVQRHP